MAKPTYLQRIQEAIKMREATRNQAVERTLAGVPADFVGPTQTPEASTPEQQAAQAIARSRILAQQAQQVVPPSLEQLNLKPRDVGKMSSNTKSLLTQTLLGDTEKQSILGRLGAAQQEASASQDQIKLNEQQRQLAANAAVREALTRGQSSLTGGAKALGEAAALQGDTGAYAQAFSVQHQQLENKRLLDQNKRSEEAFLAMKGGLQHLQETGKSNDPRALGDLQLRIGVMADDKNALGEASRLFSGIASDEALQRERDKNTQSLAEQIRSHNFSEARQITDQIIELHTKLAPAGVDLDSVMAFVMGAHGEELPQDMSQRIYDSVDQMREPLQRAAKISQAIEAEKTQNLKSDRYFEEYKRYFDEKTGAPKGWLKENANKPSGFTVGGKPLTMQEYFESYFRDRQKEFLSPIEGQSGGVTGARPPALEQNTDLLSRLKARSDAAAADQAATQAQADAQAEQNRKQFGVGGTAQTQGNRPAPLR